MAEAAPISLRGIDLIVSYREANEERRENLYTVLAHLARTYTDYRLWLVEAAVAPRFDWHRVGDARTRHVFIPHDGPFPKSMLYNTGVRLSRSAVICFHDADSIAQPQSLRACVDALMEGPDSDALCPYWSVINLSGALKTAFMAQPDFSQLAAIGPEHMPEGASVLYSNANGGIVLFKRSEYIRVGGYNARLEGWGGEDDELLRRASRLGVRWHSMNVPLYHLHHDSSSRIEHRDRIRDTENFRAPEAIADMSLEEVEALARELARFFEPD